MNDANPLHLFLWSLEAPILFIGLVVNVFFAFKWYDVLQKTWPKIGKRQVLVSIAWTPIISLILIIAVILSLAAPSVTESAFYILFYTVIGLFFVFCQAWLMKFFWDLSWWDDLLNLNNKAAVLPFTGGMLGTAIIYAAMNAGDGDGWWCVVVPFFMCWALWFLLAVLLLARGGLAEAITVGRDIKAGRRFSAYLFASALLISWINMGDWTSFAATVSEFLASWPLLILAFVALLIEKLSIRGSEV